MQNFIDILTGQSGLTAVCFSCDACGEQKMLRRVVAAAAFATQYEIFDKGYFSESYSSSVTGSSHSLEAFSPGISKARWANQLSAAAPCQCFTLAGM